MKILIATDKFKGTLTAAEACSAISSGIRELDSSIKTIEIPLADGGEGSVSILHRGIQRL